MPVQTCPLDAAQTLCKEVIISRLRNQVDLAPNSSSSILRIRGIKTTNIMV